MQIEAFFPTAHIYEHMYKKKIMKLRNSQIMPRKMLKKIEENFSRIQARFYENPVSPRKNMFLKNVYSG